MATETSERQRISPAYFLGEFVQCPSCLRFWKWGRRAAKLGYTQPTQLFRATCLACHVGMNDEDTGKDFRRWYKRSRPNNIHASSVAYEGADDNQLLFTERKNIHPVINDKPREIFRSDGWKVDSAKT